MRALHTQASQQARLEQTFQHAKKPVAYLDWAGVQTARARAVRLFDACDADTPDAVRLERAFDAALITWLSVLPPDRVAVARKLQLGGTLKVVGSNGAGEYALDLSTPDAHKTSLVFGPTCTSVPAVVGAQLGAWLRAAELQPRQRPFVFVRGDNRTAPLPPVAWTRLIKALFLKHSGVALCPKTLRASFVTHLKSSGAGPATLDAAAWMMHHSPRQQGSGAYDREAGDRRAAAAVRAAGDFAARFA